MVLPGQTLTVGVGIIGTPDVQTAGVSFVVDVYAVFDDFSVAPTGTGTVTLITADPHDVDPALAALVAGHAAFTIDPRTATNLGWQIQPSGAPGINVASDPYIVGPAAVDQTVVVLPGETLEAGLGFQDTPDHQVVGSPFDVDAVAIDVFFNTVPDAVGDIILRIDCAAYCEGADTSLISPVSQPLVGGQATITITPSTLGSWTTRTRSGPGVHTPSTPYQVSLLIDAAAGTGDIGFAGDDGPALEARFTLPLDVARDSAGNLYVADSGNNRVRRITPSGIITTFAGGGSGCPGPPPDDIGDGCLATQATLSSVTGLAVDAADNVYIVDQFNQRVRKVDSSGIINTVAGNGTAGYNGDGGPATDASLRYPFAIAFDFAGNLYIADTSNHAIRRVTPGGTISTVTGTGVAGYSGDGFSAAFARASFAEVPASTSGNSTFSCALSTGSRLYAWNTKPIEVAR